MKIKSPIVLTILSLFFLVNCNNDDDNQKATNSHAINGSWNLTNVSGGLAGINMDYNLGEVIWTFNDNTNQLVVENNIITTGPEDIYAGLDSGNYPYEIIEEEGSEVLYITDTERGSINISNNTLTIDQRYADGFAHLFER